MSERPDQNETVAALATSAACRSGTATAAA
jgi:hypothetical protein